MRGDWKRIRAGFNKAGKGWMRDGRKGRTDEGWLERKKGCMRDDWKGIRVEWGVTDGEKGLSDGSLERKWNKGWTMDDWKVNKGLMRDDSNWIRVEWGMTGRGGRMSSVPVYTEWVGLVWLETPTRNQSYCNSTRQSRIIYHGFTSQISGSTPFSHSASSYSILLAIRQWFFFWGQNILHILNPAQPIKIPLFSRDVVLCTKDFYQRLLFSYINLDYNARFYFCPYMMYYEHYIRNPYDPFQNILITKSFIIMQLHVL